MTPNGERDTRLIQLRRFASWLDAGFHVPGTAIRFGLDPIIGLVPGVGDAAGAILSMWILGEAVRRAAPRTTVVRIAANIAIDTVVGGVPLLGDLFDVAWKANLRNVELLERHAADPVRARAADRLFVAVLGASVIALTVAVGVVSVLAARWLFRLAAGS